MAKSNQKDNCTSCSKVERMCNEDEDDPSEKFQRGPKPKPKPKLKAEEKGLEKNRNDIVH